MRPDWPRSAGAAGKEGLELATDACSPGTNSLSFSLSFSDDSLSFPSVSTKFLMIISDV